MDNLFVLDEALSFLGEGETFESLVESINIETSLNEAFSFDKVKEIFGRFIELIKKFISKIKEAFIKGIEKLITKLKEFRKKQKEKIAALKDKKANVSESVVLNESADLDNRLRSETITMRSIGAFCKAIQEDLGFSTGKFTGIAGDSIIVGIKHYTLDEYYKLKGCEAKEITLLDFINTYSDEDLWIGKLEEVKKFHNDIIKTWENTIKTLNEYKSANSEEDIKGIFAKINAAYKDYSYNKGIESLNKSISLCNKILVDCGEMVSKYTSGTLKATRILNDYANEKASSGADVFALIIDTDGDLLKMYNKLK